MTVHSSVKYSEDANLQQVAIWMYLLCISHLESGVDKARGLAQR
jgi:hypothetical protein